MINFCCSRLRHARKFFSIYPPSPLLVVTRDAIYKRPLTVNESSRAPPFLRVYDQIPYDYLSLFILHSPSLSLSLSLSPSLPLTPSLMSPFLSLYLSPTYPSLFLPFSRSPLPPTYLSLSVFPPLLLLSLHIFSRGLRFAETTPLNRAV